MSEARDGDWRLTVRFRSERQRATLLGRLSERAAAASAESRVRERASVRREGPWLRLYASSYDSLSRAQAAILPRCRNLTRPPRSAPNSLTNAAGSGQQSTPRWYRRSRRNASGSTTGTVPG